MQSTIFDLVELQIFFTISMIAVSEPKLGLRNRASGLGLRWPRPKVATQGHLARGLGVRICPPARGHHLGMVSGLNQSLNKISYPFYNTLLQTLKANIRCRILHAKLASVTAMALLSLY